MNFVHIGLFAVIAAVTAGEVDGDRAWAQEQGGGQQKAGHGMSIGRGMVLPEMNAAHGRQLFAAKGCVVCHSVNGVGGKDGPAMDASTMELPMNPFEFAARMWGGAEAMVALQRNELGAQISLTGDELGDLIAFVHDAEEQKKFSEADIPPDIMKAMGNME